MDNQILSGRTLINTTRMLNGFLKALERSTTRIPVHIHSQEVPITVQGLGESKELDWCNHASSYMTLIPNDVSDNPTNVVATVCDRCPSVMNELGSWS